MKISVHWAISISVAGHWPVYLEWFLALFVASGVPWTTRSCVSFGKSKTPGLETTSSVSFQVASAWRGAWLVLDAELWPQRRWRGGGS